MVEEAVVIWSAKSPAFPPASSIKSQQKAWDKPVETASYQSTTPWWRNQRIRSLAKCPSSLLAGSQNV
jgi:hypothetical protein